MFFFINMVKLWSHIKLAVVADHFNNEGKKAWKYIIPDVIGGPIMLFIMIIVYVASLFENSYRK